MLRWIAAICLCFAVTAVLGQENEAARANRLFQELKRLEALPLYEDLAKQFPNEMLYWERLADCLGAESAQVSDPAELKAIRTRMRDAAKRAVELGDTTVYVKEMAAIDPDAPTFAGISGSQGKVLLAEAEKAYTAGNFDLALTKYAAAAEADPHLYEAPLFAGDTAYLQKDLKTAARWFARAIAIDPDRETAYRYWGDAILKYGDDPAAAREKFIDAVVAEPYSDYAWQGIKQWAQVEKAVVLAPKIDRPAVPKINNGHIEFQLDFGSLNEKKNPGGFAWMTYSIVRSGYYGEPFKRDFPSEKTYRHTLKEEDLALSMVASTVKEKKLKANKLDESLRNLIELNDAGMLDCWILINGADQGIAQDYEAYRKEHRKLLHEYLERFVVHGGPIREREQGAASPHV